LNFATYILWWHKPLGVGEPVRVYKSRPKGLKGGEAGGDAVEVQGERKDEDGAKARWVRRLKGCKAWVWTTCKGLLTGFKRGLVDFLKEVYRPIAETPGIKPKKSCNIQSKVRRPRILRSRDGSDWNSLRWDPLHCLGLCISVSNRTTSLAYLRDICYDSTTFGRIYMEILYRLPAQPQPHARAPSIRALLCLYPVISSVHLCPCYTTCTSLYVAEVTPSGCIPYSRLDSLYSTHLIAVHVLCTTHLQCI